MSAKRWALSIFFVWHVTAIALGSLASPGTILPVEPASYAANDAIAATITPYLDPVAAALEDAPAAITRATRPLPRLAAVYLSLTGVSQSWKMFANPPEVHQYLRVRYYIGPSGNGETGTGGRVWTATELVLPAHREDELRLFRAYWDAFRDKAMTSALGRFHNARDETLVRANTTSAELPDHLAPIARYFARRFERQALRPNERILRTEVWYGMAPMTPPRTPPDPTKIAARLRTLREYYQGPVHDYRRRSGYPVYHVAEQEGEIQWLLEYFEP